MSKLTVFLSPPKGTQNDSDFAHGENAMSVSFKELRSWVSSGKIFFHLFRYKETNLVAHDLRLISKPFALALLMRVLARKKSVMQDAKGVSQNITMSVIFSLFLKLLKDFTRKKKFLDELNKSVNSLINNQYSKEKEEIDITEPPIYLRTDFCFGLQSGGSVGHIAGVLNNLSHFSGKPIFLTTDFIPTVREDWESHIITPGNAFWDFSELPPLHFNDVFLKRAIECIGNRKPSFIYQRYSINNFSGVQLARHYRSPFVLEFNGSEVWVNRHWGGSILKYEALAEEIELLNLRACDLVVVVSEPLKTTLIGKGIDSNKILVNPNGVSPEKYSPEIDGGGIRKKYHLEKKIVIGFIGTFGKWHGAEILAEAYGRLLNNFPELRDTVRLFVIGDGTTMPLVKKTLIKMDVLGYCQFTGIIPQEEGPSHLAACDILVSPHVPNVDGSPFFGSPTKLFEYMAMGKGIVASNLDQIGDILKHNQSAWMVKPGDPESLMMGIKALIDAPTTRNRLGKAARDDVVSRFTWKEHTRKIIETLRRIYGK